MQQHPHEKIMLDHLNEIGNQNLEALIYRILNQLEFYYPTPSPLPDYAELERTVDKNLAHESSLAAQLASWNIEMDRERPPVEEKLKKALRELNAAKRHEKENRNNKTIKALESAKRAVSKAKSAQHKLYFSHSIRYTMVFAKLAIKANSEGKTDKAMAYCSEASFRYGEISASSKLELKTIISESKRNNALNRNTSIQMAKDHAIELLKTRKPTDGWPSKQRAASDIQEELKRFVCNNNLSGITPSNVINTLLKTWSTKDADVKRAFEASLTPNKLTSDLG